MSWSQAQSQAQPDWQQQQLFQTPAFHFHLTGLIEKLTEAVEAGAQGQQVDELVGEIAGRFRKAEQILNTLGSNATEKDVATQRKTLEDHRNNLEERRVLLAKYKSMVESVYPAET